WSGACGGLSGGAVPPPPEISNRPHAPRKASRWYLSYAPSTPKLPRRHQSALVADDLVPARPMKIGPRAAVAIRLHAAQEDVDQAAKPLFVLAAVANPQQADNSHRVDACLDQIVIGHVRGDGRRIIGRQEVTLPIRKISPTAKPEDEVNESDQQPAVDGPGAAAPRTK